MAMLFALMLYFQHKFEVANEMGAKKTIKLFPTLVLNSPLVLSADLSAPRSHPPPCLSQGINNEDNWQEHYYDGLDTQRIHKNNDY